MTDLAVEILAGVESKVYRETDAILCDCEPHRRNKVGRYYAGPQGASDARIWFVTNPFRRSGTSLGTVPPAAAHVPRPGELAWTLPTECRRCHRVYVVFLGGTPEELRELEAAREPAWVIFRFDKPTTDDFAVDDDVETVQIVDWRKGPNGSTVGVATPPNHARVAP